MSDTKLQIQEAQRTPSKINAKKNPATTRHHIQTSENQRLKEKNQILDFPGGPLGKTPGSPGSIPGRGTRSHMQAATKSSHIATRSPHVATKKSTCRN